MANLEEAYIHTVPYRPLSWIRYINDVSTIWQHSWDQFDDFVRGLNRLDHRIQFTSELSQTSTTFLDVCIYKSPSFFTRGKLATTTSYKSTNTFSHAMGMSHIAHVPWYRNG